MRAKYSFPSPEKQGLAYHSRNGKGRCSDGTAVEQTHPITTRKHTQKTSADDLQGQIGSCRSRPVQQLSRDKSCAVPF